MGATQVCFEIGPAELHPGKVDRCGRGTSGKATDHRDGKKRQHGTEAKKQHPAGRKQEAEADETGDAGKHRGREQNPAKHVGSAQRTVMSMGMATHELGLVTESQGLVECAAQASRGGGPPRNANARACLDRRARVNADSVADRAMTSSAPDFWEKRYATGRTPWDAGGVPAALRRHLFAHPGRGARVLIPGCGSGYEIVAFAEAGYDVLALDFSREAVQRAKRKVGPALAPRVREGDFFTLDFGATATFDLIYERTFLCALSPDMWPRIVARTAELLRPGGRLVGIYFYGGKEDGPPFGLTSGEAEQLFHERFVLTKDEPIPPAESLPLFAGRERWQERSVRNA